MSKKLYSTGRWKRYLKSRQQSELRRAQRRKQRGRARKQFHVQPEKRQFYRLAAPSMFSIVKNPDGMVVFLRNLEFYAQRHNLELDLSGVEAITTDAVAVLVATVKSLGVVVRGTVPKNSEAQRVLMQSGFFDHFKSAQPLPEKIHGVLREKQSRKVQPDLAADLIHFGTAAIGGKQRRSPPAYRALIEGMLNTHNHAAGRKRPLKRETWWATVYADEQRQRVCFTFVDTGVGIFRSVRVGIIRKVYRLFGVRDDVDIMRDLLHGRVESSTGIPYRGKGLPAMYELAKSDRIKSLVIIANGVYANVSAGEYQPLRAEFRGTLLYWEI